MMTDDAYRRLGFFVRLIQERTVENENDGPVFTAHGIYHRALGDARRSDFRGDETDRSDIERGKEISNALGLAVSPRLSDADDDAGIIGKRECNKVVRECCAMADRQRMRAEAFERELADWRAQAGKWCTEFIDALSYVNAGIGSYYDNAGDDERPALLRKEDHFRALIDEALWPVYLGRAIDSFVRRRVL